MGTGIVGCWRIIEPGLRIPHGLVWPQVGTRIHRVLLQRYRADGQQRKAEFAITRRSNLARGLLGANQDHAERATPARRRPGGSL